MSYCFAARPVGKETKKRRKIGDSGTGIPPAPAFKTKIRNVDYDFEERKVRYKDVIPIYTFQQVQRLSLSFDELMMRSLADSGYTSVVEELSLILSKEGKWNENSCHLKNTENSPLSSSPQLFKRLAETLKFSQDLVDTEKPGQALTLRKDLAIDLIQDKRNWLALHLLETCLRKADLLKADSDRDRIKAECHCLIAYLSSFDCDLRTSTFQVSLFHLKICRELTENQSWNFKPGVIVLRIKKPIYIHGFRDEEKTIDGSIMHIYHIASLLEYEMLIKLVDQFLFKDNISDQDVLLAADYTDDALNLAIQVHEATAISSALIRFGNVLHGMGCFDEALDYFDQLQVQAELMQDKETESLGFNGLATCFQGKKDPLSALEMLAVQRELAENILDLEAEACQEIGMTLLAEGQTFEGKLCMNTARNKFEDGKMTYKTPPALLDDSWALAGVSLGQDIWGRYAGLTRRKSTKDMRALVEFKNFRKALPEVKRPNYKADLVYDDLALIAAQDLPPPANKVKVSILPTTNWNVHPTKEIKKDGLRKKKSVIFHGNDSNSSPDYDSFSQSISGSSASPSIFDSDVVYASDFLTEKQLLANEFLSGNSNSSKSALGSLKDAVVKTEYLIRAVSRMKSDRGGAPHSSSTIRSQVAFSSAGSIIKTNLSPMSLNRIQPSIVPKSELKVASLGIEPQKRSISHAINATATDENTKLDTEAIIPKQPSLTFTPSSSNKTTSSTTTTTTSRKT